MECMVVSKRDSTRSELQIGDDNQTEKVIYLSNVETGDWKCGAAFQRHIGIGKDAFQRVNKV